MNKRTAWITTGTLALVTGGVLGISGAVALSVFGRDDAITSGTNSVTSPAAAIVTEPGDFAYDSTDALGRPTVTIAVKRSSKPMFVGVARAAEVDRYLAGAPVATVTDAAVEPFRLETELSAGTSTMRPPGGESFWTASTDGVTPLEWTLADGEYRIVVMNADGSAGIAADARFDLVVPHIGDVGTGLIVAAAMIVVFGLAALVLAGRAQPFRPNGSPYPAANWPTTEDRRSPAP